jgi:alpha-L-rhamnosidase
MNHYCYASIVEGSSRRRGLRQTTTPALKGRDRPGADRRLDFVRCVYDSAAGRYESAWEREGGNVRYTVTVPFDAQAEFRFPDGRTVCLEAGTHVLP